MFHNRMMQIGSSVGGVKPPIPRPESLLVHISYETDSPVDLTPNNNNGTIVGNVSFETLPVGRALVLNVSDVYQYHALNQMSFMEGCTISAFMKTTNYYPGSLMRVQSPADYRCLITSWTTAGAPSGVAVGSCTSWYYALAMGTTNICTGQVFHLCMTHEANGYSKIYVNGVYEGVSYYTGYYPCYPVFWIGQYQSVGLEPFIGSVCHPMVYDVALTDAEVTQLYQSLLP